MYHTKINPIVLKAALQRKGLWVVDQNGNAKFFFHKECIKNYTFSQLIQIGESNVS